MTTTDTPRLVMLEDISDPDDAAGALDEPGWAPPVRTLRDRKGNRYVLLPVAMYVRLIAGQGVSRE